MDNRQDDDGDLPLDRTVANPPRTGDAPTTITPPPTPAPSGGGSTSKSSSSRSSALSSEIKLSAPIEDLLTDRLLTTLPRVEINGRSVPSLGGIALISKLGQGGMGAVYHGVKLMLRQEVAVKVLPLHLAAMQPEFAERFVREAQLAASIESPHLVRVTDVDETEGLFYLVMELVRGTSAGSHLKKLIQSGQGLGEAAALDLCIAATSGLAAAHAQGVVHRDIKPDNIMIPKARGEDTLLLAAAKVTDLGLARSEELAQSLTGAQAGMGTPGYMAPEQVSAAHNAGKRADVFGMAATLYALLTGRAPFRGDSSTAVLMATIMEPHTPIRQLRPDVSEATAALLDRCLAKTPEGRFADATALLEGLRICRHALGSDAGSGAVEQLTQLLSAPEVGQRVISSLPAARESSVLPVGIACDHNKQEWLKWAVAEYGKTEAGKGAGITLLIMSAAEAQEAILALDKRIQVWFPSSGIYRHLFTTDWERLAMTEKRLTEGVARGLGSQPFIREETLSLTPQVFVMYEDRYQALIKRYGSLNFDTLHQALQAPDGWATINGKKEWGPFNFAITDPTRYTHGLSALVLISYELAGKTRDLTVEDVSSPRHIAWVAGFEHAFDTAGDPVQALRDMVLKGPSAYDGVCTYEGNAMQQIENAEDRWGAVRIIYPEINIWNDSPYCVLNTPVSSEQQRKAANDFLDFLLTEPVQKKAVTRGFRPGNADTRIRFPESPFVRLARFGVKSEIPVTVEPLKAEVLAALVDRHSGAK